MKKKLTILFGILSMEVFTPNAHSYYFTESETCVPLDLRNDFELKMRNQGDISWCYAHAAADYLQFIHRIPVQISAADIAIKYNLRRWPRFRKWLMGDAVPETGFIRDAILDIDSIGYCPEEYFPSETWTKRFLIGEFAGKKIEVPIKNALKDFMTLVEQVREGFFLAPKEIPFVFEFKGISEDQFMEVLFRQETGDSLQELRSLACGSHRVPFSKNIKFLSREWRGRNSFHHINESLDSRMPVTVDFFYGLLENVDYYEYSVSELHTALLMGRRFHATNGECQYLIKDSYGSDCSQYDPRHECEGGYLWINESDLFGAMTSLVRVLDFDTGFSGTVQQRQDESSVR